MVALAVAPVSALRPVSRLKSAYMPLPRSSRPRNPMRLVLLTPLARPLTDAAAGALAAVRPDACRALASTMPYTVGPPCWANAMAGTVSAAARTERRRVICLFVFVVMCAQPPAAPRNTVLVGCCCAEEGLAPKAHAQARTDDEGRRVSGRWRVPCRCFG